MEENQREQRQPTGTDPSSTRVRFDADHYREVRSIINLSQTCCNDGHFPNVFHSGAARIEVTLHNRVGGLSLLEMLIMQRLIVVEGRAHVGMMGAHEVVSNLLSLPGEVQPLLQTGRWNSC